MKFSRVSSLEELLKKANMNSDKKYMVQRVIKDYEDTWYVNIKAFDDEDAATEYMHNMWDNDPIDSYRIEEE